MISEFIKGIKKDKSKSTPAEAEAFKVANQIYDGLKKGGVRRMTRRTIIKLVEAINPELSDTEKVLCGICIESLIPAFLTEFLLSGTLITIRKK